MKKMTAVLMLVIVFFTLKSGRGNATGITAAAVTPVDPAGLWQKALDIFRKNSDFYPGKITILSEILNRHDRPDSVTQLFFSIYMDTRGQLFTEMTRALKNGKDISDEMKKKVEIRDLKEDKVLPKKDSLTVSLSDSPFNPERQKNVSFHASAEKQMLFGHFCRRFDFTYQTEIVRKGEPEKLTWSGMAWLDENSGLPLKLEFSLEPLPKRIHSLWTIYLYEITPPDNWVLKKITISGQGGFLFIKKRFRSTTNFSDYRRQPQRGD
ncbi:MAG: hypothetical protein L6428_03845 [Candidatus Aminicenantes bacterium]|nr:hypothetical protein [Acidobacteriota bacterium]MCG2810578.1 hypothetical protein [Candidatus Aminicenantes bacterium]